MASWFVTSAPPPSGLHEHCELPQESHVHIRLPDLVAATERVLSGTNLGHLDNEYRHGASPHVRRDFGSLGVVTVADELAEKRECQRIAGPHS
jgi:hypothetical protein